MNQAHHDLVVIGAGPGGYTAAIRAAQLGMNVGCIEGEKLLGGTCLRVGCIPSKAMLESSERFWAAKQEFESHGIKIGSLELDLATMLKRKEGIVRTLTKGIEGLFKKHGITRYEGHGRIDGPGKVVVEGAAPATLTAKNILIVTGSKPAPLPGVELDGDRIGTSTEALSYPSVPEHLVVIGAGYIGIELGSVWKRLGSAVTVLEYFPRILPGMDTDLSNEAEKIFKKQGMQFRLGCKVTAAKVVKDRCIVETEGNEPIQCDRVLLAVGRVPNTDGLGLESVGIATDKRGAIPINDHFSTGVPGIYAVGDVVRGPMLAHKAEEEAVACVEYLASGYGHVDYDTIPGVVYTHPEIATVGKSEDQLKEQGVAYRKGTFPFMANARAKALGDTSGYVKMLADAATDRVLGVHIIGPRAGDLIAEAAAAMAYGASSEDIARTCHAHPTLSEVLREAALAVDGRPLNI
ncbi:MAG: dihydrolipoyl dehydrogenase [Candidatus Hydrogenedentes bacterium]|nr:dihydrolipoyl dehydrogenase [Candidatus Hydrogenedentota bacterium]